MIYTSPQIARNLLIFRYMMLAQARARVLPDRMETGTYAMAVAMAGGDILLQNARPELPSGARRAGGDRHKPCTAAQAIADPSINSERKCDE